MSDNENVTAKGHHGETVEIKVNNKMVAVKGPRVTGLQIKEAAIAQGVTIDLDFQLAEVEKSGGHKIIGDNDVITVTKHSEFRATAGDDNSSGDE